MTSKKLFGILIILGIFSFIIIHNSNYLCVQEYEKYPLTCSGEKQLVKQHLLKALRFTRSNIVKQELIQALQILSKDIQDDLSEIKFNRIQQIESHHQLHDVCLEEFRGIIDHPLYNLGQIEIKCRKKPFGDVLTFIIIVDKCQDIPKLVKSIHNIYNQSRIIVGSFDNEDCNLKLSSLTSIMNRIVTVRDLSNVLGEVKTDYILFAHNLYHFDNQSKIERLVQMVSYTNVKVAAGSARLENGKLSMSCYQMAMKMYTLKLVEGYDMSFNSCMYCDYSPAPFVTRTSFFLDQMKTKRFFDKDLFLLDFYVDMMMGQVGQILVCPDVMFHTKPYDLSLIKRNRWFDFVSKFELNRIIPPDSRDMNFSCSESKMSCYKVKGIMVPLCCLKELSDSLKFMKRLLNEANVTFEVLEGTVMGGLKYKNILYWERDADTNFRVQAIDKMEAKLGDIKKQGYSMSIYYECPYKRDHEKCRHAGWHGSIYYAYRTQNWRTEMYGVTYILSDFRGKLKNPTKINIDGEWYITYTNPALYGRNIYGGDIFQHQEHYSTLGITQAEYAKLFSGSFPKCPRPGFHGCLDNFAGEGSLQFVNIYI